MQLFLPKYEVEECVDAIRKVLESGWTGCGPVCRQFEQDWSSFTGASHCHYMSSATAALHVALRLCNLPPESHVLTTPLTFVSTNAVILYENHIPVFVDINEDDLSLDADDFLLKKERYKSKAAMWVHYGGNISDHFYKVAEALKSELGKSFTLIEDCAHASGARYKDGKALGSSPSTYSCFSFHSVKNLPTFDSGMLCVNSEAVNQRARKLSWLGIDKDTFARTNSTQTDLYKWRYDVPELGWKYNGNDVAASIACVQLKYLDRDNKKRHQMFQWYKDNLESNKNLKIMKHSPHSSHHLFVLRVKNRDEMIKILKDNGIAAGVHYLPNNDFPIFQKYYTPGECPVLEKISGELISLPNHLTLTKEDIDRVSEVVNAAAKS
ncbi:MAG: DegT/DnrJ/EryC1/StrS family aminotransferase [Parachlamydiales bacterium]|jgi:dTDP-4-amino-4,6-dideoxygalactose transaminase